MISKDTICAVSTPHGVGGIAVVRLSGTEAKSMAEQLLRTFSGAVAILKDRYACHLKLVKPAVSNSGNHIQELLLDEVVVTLFASPHSFTGEDVVEIACHGSLYVQQEILRALCSAGARLAEPGEFTMRAFLNRKLNLSQAEAVADLIDSRSASAHRLAISQLRGGYSAELEFFRQQLIDMSALLELELDFSEEDLEFVNREHLKDLVDMLSAKVGHLIDSFAMGNAIKNGIPVAIVGSPNVGKSSLLNALLGDERAIVSPIAGTTRDTVEDTITIDGVMFRFVDTAGLRESDDPVEKQGIERSRRAMDQARLVVVVTDSDCTDESASLFSQATAAGKGAFLVYNKEDMSQVPCYGAVADRPGCYRISARYGYGIDELRKGLLKGGVGDVNSGDVMLTNERHLEAMKRILAALAEVRKGLDVNLTADLLAIDLRDALYHLGTITGVITSDDILSSVFSRFCVGK